jgi:hypothetical protein
LKAYSQVHGKDFADTVLECATWAFTDEADILARAASGSGGWLVNPDKGQTVENAFSMVNHLSQMLREKYKII